MASLFPSPELVKQWQQQYTKKYTTLINNCVSTQQTALAQYTQQLAVNTRSIDKNFTKVLSWDKYTFDSYIIPLNARSYSGSLFQEHNQEHNLVALLVRALCPRAIALRVPARNNITLDLSCLTTELSYSQYGLFVEHIKLYIEPEARVTLILGSNVGAHTALIKSCEVILGAYAQVIVAINNTIDTHAYLLTHTRWQLAQHAHVTVTHNSTGGGTVITQVQYFLQEQYASASHLSLCALAANNQMVLSTEQHHLAPHTTSAVQVKQVVRDAARVYYTGLIMLDRQAHESVAEQGHAALLVSPQARASAVPALEIHTKEVRCRHASAIGAITPEYIWALQLRGLEHSQAQELIIEGFLGITTYR